MQSFTVLCAEFHTILCTKIATVKSSIQIDLLIMKYLPQNYMLMKHLGREDFRTIF